MKKTISRILTVCACFCAFSFSSCEKEKKVATVYEITAEYSPENGTLAGASKVTFQNCTDSALSVLKFQLYPNAYREDALYRPVSKACETSAYYAGESYGEMVISSVNGAKNWEVLGEDENILYAYLERALYPEEKVVLDIAFLIKLAKVNHRTGITKKTVNLGNCFPTLCGIKDGGFLESVYYDDGDPFYSDCADYKVTVKTPKEYLVASSGAEVSERTLESKKEYTVSLTNARDFALVLSDCYKKAEGDADGVRVYYYYYDDKNAQKRVDLIEEAFAFFRETFGAYPYPTFTLAQTGFCQGGMEYPALAMISDSLSEENAVRSAVHEIAHQWWYAVVGSNQIENAWQDEGLAEYSALVFFENYEKYGVSREACVASALKEYRSYYDVYGSVLGRTDTAMTRHLKDFISDYEYKCLSYDKAVVMFDTLRKSVGDKKFFAGLKRYYAENAFENATPDSLIGAFERVGLDARGFFESFLQGKAIL